MFFTQLGEDCFRSILWGVGRDHQPGSALQGVRSLRLVSFPIEPTSRTPSALFHSNASEVLRGAEKEELDGDRVIAGSQRTQHAEMAHPLPDRGGAEVKLTPSEHGVDQTTGTDLLEHAGASNLKILTSGLRWANTTNERPEGEDRHPQAQRKSAGNGALTRFDATGDCDHGMASVHASGPGATSVAQPRRSRFRTGTSPRRCASVTAIKVA